MKVNNDKSILQKNFNEMRSPSHDKLETHSTSTNLNTGIFLSLQQQLTHVRNVDGQVVKLPMLHSSEHYIANEQRLLEIVNDLLPSKDIQYQLAQTDKFNSTKLNSANEIYTNISIEKKALQNEAIALFLLQSEKMDFDTINHSLYKMIFSLAYSYDELLELLNGMELKDSFMRFAADKNNSQDVVELFRDLRLKMTNSLEAELAIRKLSSDSE